MKTRPGDANIVRPALALPRSEFLDQAHIRTVCTRVQFAADACPKGATYGRAWVQTPILDYPLTGNVYLRSSDNLLPDLVPDLRGPAYQPIRIESAGRTDSIKGGIRNTFSFIPDAPFTKLVTRLQAGKKGLLDQQPQHLRAHLPRHRPLQSPQRPHLPRPPEAARGLQAQAPAQEPQAQAPSPRPPQFGGQGQRGEVGGGLR